MHHVDASVNFPADLPPVLADPIMFQRVIENLLDNAVKYSPENENISIFARTTDGMVEFCVADRGEAKDMPIPVMTTRTLMKSIGDRENLARQVVAFAGTLLVGDDVTGPSEGQDA